MGVEKALEDVEGVEIPPELREACHSILSRSEDATTALGDPPGASQDSDHRGPR